MTPKRQYPALRNISIMRSTGARLSAVTGYEVDECRTVQCDVLKERDRPGCQRATMLSPLSTQTLCKPASSRVHVLRGVVYL